jgi:hypothetical protein
MISNAVAPTPPQVKTFARNGHRFDIAAVARGVCAQAEFENRHGMGRHRRNRLRWRDGVPIAQADLLSQLVSGFALRQTDRRPAGNATALQRRAASVRDRVPCRLDRRRADWLRKTLDARDGEGIG